MGNLQTELVDRVRSYDPGAVSLVRRAYQFSMKAHGSQLRSSGDPYFAHPVEVAGILADMKLDGASIATALLHDVVEDTLATLDDVERDFGAEVAKLVDGVTKLSQLEMPEGAKPQAENWRKLFLAMSNDIRVLLVKLADRLHNMQTLAAHKDPEKRRRIAQETMDIYAPLAERIGMQDLKEQLEDLAFAQVNPDARESVLQRLRYLRKSSGDVLGRITAQLRHTLYEAGIDADVQGREKRPWSIFQKMQRDAISFEQLSDIVAFRIIVATREECYRALGVVHGAFQMVPARFKDYISTPKPNGYRSIHTTVIGPEKHRIEVQIRSKDMHREAEFGVAAHWTYKQSVDAVDGTQYRWVRELLEILDHSSPEEFLENTKLEMFQDQVFCFSPGGRLIALPRGATPVDFAYAVHTDIGDTTVGAKVNGRIVPLRTRLKNGDQVEIIRSEAQTPSPSWESFVVTGRARAAIRRFRAKQERGEYERLGKAMVRSAFAEVGHEEIKDDAVAVALKTLRQKSVEDLYVAVGDGHLAARAVVEAVLPGEAARAKEARKAAAAAEAAAGDDKAAEAKPDGKAEPKVDSGGKALRKGPGKAGDQAIPIRGLIPGMAVHFGTCCHPLPGDRIVGIVSAGKGITIHTIDCESLEAFAESPERWIDVSWEAAAKAQEIHTARIRTVLANVPGSLATLCSVIARNNGNISNLTITDRNPEFFEMRVDVEVRDLKHLTNIIAALRIDPAIASVERLRG
ncbi:MAG: bifunctional (p)ppGpp synthetase/guanosine-3',5'-bis(diphosphate) 3'-pyrophosphohydrolase [Alphaproteobacteria bacterium]|nr:bifunctional (p)ppGpp synthetase/guanosine-3',5'-bis(diphosphate) 3'-pyrophosphohydrolase [Alphaproteobacteria bacterium]